MGSTAVQIVTQAYRHHNLNEVTTFNTGLEFPYKLALDIINEVIRYMNRLGSFHFMETKTALAYGVGTNSYSFTTLNVDPKRITYIRKEATDHWGDLSLLNWRDFQAAYRSSAVVTAEPTVWSKYGDTLYLNSTPGEDYSIYVYHFRDMPAVTATTDTFIVPERDEDVLIDCCFQILGYKMGRWNYETAYAVMQSRVAPYLVAVKNDAALPTQFPAAF